MSEEKNTPPVEKKTSASAKLEAAKLEISDDKKKALEATINQLEKQYGKGSIMRLGSREIEAIPVIPTGALTLDLALGVGGIPYGRITEIYGPEASGKTTLTLSLMQKHKNKVLLVRSLMQNMLWLLDMLKISVSILITYSFHNLIMENKL